MPKPTRANDRLREEQQRAPGRKTQAPTAQAAPASRRLRRLPDNPAAATPADVTQLQTRFGNRAVRQLLSAPTVQAKLAVGPASDRYEQEADQVAEQVMRMPADAGKDEEEKA